MDLTSKERLCDSMWASCGRTQAIFFLKCFLVRTFWHKNIYTSWHKGFLLTGPRAHKQTQSTDLARERERDCNGGGKAGRYTDCRVAYYHTPNEVVYYHTLCVSHITTPTNSVILPHKNQTHCMLYTWYKQLYTATFSLHIQNCTSHMEWFILYTAHFIQHAQSNIHIKFKHGKLLTAARPLAGQTGSLYITWNCLQQRCALCSVQCAVQPPTAILQLAHIWQN